MSAAADAERRLDAALIALVARVPYNAVLGVAVERLGDELTMRLPFAPHLVGNPFLPALHGGVTGSFLEIAALTQLAWDRLAAALAEEATLPAAQAAQAVAEERFAAMPRTVDVTVDYLRRGLPRDSFARARVQKTGRRVAHVHVEAWQEARDRPFAMLRGNFLMPDA
ncbi:MAG: PaaI family thioesterase [Pseudomonadota bacterium]